MADKIDVKLLPKSVGKAKSLIAKDLNYELKKLADGSYVINIQIPITAEAHYSGHSSNEYRRKTLDIKTNTKTYDLNIEPYVNYIANPMGGGAPLEDLSRMMLSLKLDIGGKKPPENGNDD